MLIDNYAEILYSSLLQSAIYILTIPAVATMICGFIAMAIIKLIIGRLVYSFSMVSGYTHRQARRRARKSQELVDVVSAINDVSSTFIKKR